MLGTLYNKGICLVWSCGGLKSEAWHWHLFNSGGWWNNGKGADKDGGSIERK